MISSAPDTPHWSVSNHCIMNLGGKAFWSSDDPLHRTRLLGFPYFLLLFAPISEGRVFDSLRG